MISSCNPFLKTHFITCDIYLPSFCLWLIWKLFGRFATSRKVDQLPIPIVFFTIVYVQYMCTQYYDLIESEMKSEVYTSNEAVADDFSSFPRNCVTNSFLFWECGQCAPQLIFYLPYLLSLCLQLILTLFICDLDNRRKLLSAEKGVT